MINYCRDTSASDRVTAVSFIGASFEATHKDIARWKRQGREDILRHIAVSSTDPHNRHGIFVTKSCPFLKREESGLYSCAIHETKPFYCRIYPDGGMCEHEESVED